MERGRIELPLSDCKTDVLPLSLAPHWRFLSDSNGRISDLQSPPLTTQARNLGGSQADRTLTAFYNHRAFQEHLARQPCGLPFSVIFSPQNNHTCSNVLIRDIYIASSNSSTGFPSLMAHATVFAVPPCWKFPLA